MTNANICCFLFLSCWKLILAGVFRNCFETRPLSRNTCGGGVGGGGGGGRSSNIHQHPRICPARPPTPLRALRASSATVLFMNVSPQSHSFPTSECRNTVEICRLTSFCPKPKKQLPYLQFHLQAWTLGVSRFILGLFGSNCPNSNPCYNPA